MTIVTTSYRGTPARPRSELVTHINVVGGTLNLTAHNSGIEFEVHTAHSGSTRISLSDYELSTFIDALRALCSPRALRIHSDSIPQSSTDADAGVDAA